ncbi:MAG: RNA 2'-phosphotransferase [Clostridia bacterium]|nr:RNA 2'-phosphotransferase [Clostridia bacterium]
MDRQWYIALSKEVSFALRHRPERYGLTLDEDGFVPVQVFLDALNAAKPRPHTLTLEDLHGVMACSDKQRLEIRDGMIRALYGHSTKTRIDKQAAEPPAVLYHGTSHAALRAILREGLRPMKRQYVHMGADKDVALDVGARHDRAPVLLQIDAAAAHADGVAFYPGNDRIWLCDSLDPKYLRVLDA